MRERLGHLYARWWARRHGCKYAKIRGMDKGIMELPNRRRFFFSTKLPTLLPIVTGLRMLREQLEYQHRKARLEVRQ